MAKFLTTHVRLFWNDGDWRSRKHPYLWVMNGPTLFVFRSGPFELWYHKKAVK